MADGSHAEISVSSPDIDEYSGVIRQRDDPVGYLPLIKSEQLGGNIIVAPILPFLEPEPGERAIGNGAIKKVKKVPGLGELYGLNIPQPTKAAKLAP